MKPLKKLAAVALCLLLAVTLSGCNALMGFLPSSDYAEYDVSAYIEALLESSYHNVHDRFISVAQSNQETAQSNNDTTVENAAILFCNAYNLSPTDEQLAGFRQVLAQTLLSARYTVRDEERNETGYTIDVEVYPITSLAGLEEDFTRLRQEAQDEADAVNNRPTPTPEPQEDGEDEGDDWDEWGDEDEEEPDPTPTPEPTPAPARVDAYKLYVDKVLDFCRGRVAVLSYQDQAVVVTMDIRQTNEGELQLDLNQLEKIDQNVVVFVK